MLGFCRVFSIRRNQQKMRKTRVAWLMQHNYESRHYNRNHPHQFDEDVEGEPEMILNGAPMVSPTTVAWRQAEYLPPKREYRIKNRTSSIITKGTLSKRLESHNNTVVISRLR